MNSTSSENNSWKRLEILSAGGMSHLHFQFNYPSADKEAHKGEYHVLTLLMYDALRKIYLKKGLEDFEDKNFYKLDFTDNYRGFHFSVQWAYAENCDEALAIVSQVLSQVLSFDVNTHRYENAEMESLVKSNITGAKAFAEEIRKDIFEKKLFEFKKEYWSPFD